MKYELCPSILSADFNCLGEQLKTIENANVKYLHIDVMDGMFVPNISFGMPVIKSIRKESEMIFDTHLMVQDPERYIDEFVACGSDSITIHVEACKDCKKTLQRIKAAGVCAGVSIKPGTSVDEIRDLLGLVDLVLVMTVEPGFGGQKYMDSCTAKIEELRRLANENSYTYDIQVDGGINEETIETVVKAGANLIVAGSAVFKGDLTENIDSLYRLINKNAQ
ncbi:MAG: ribulose-phosphate 3-epimerase [Eubacteriales bacterium]|nr:ribulose-phosphate 3-epimerase [Eubacteriales bacterium]